MRVVDLTHPCRLCDGPAGRWRLDGQEWYTNACARCGIFVVEPTLSPRPWTQLPPEEALLVAFLPAYIWHCNRHGRRPLLTLENWRPLARRGHIVALRTLRPVTTVLSR